MRVYTRDVSPTPRVAFRVDVVEMGDEAEARCERTWRLKMVYPRERLTVGMLKKCFERASGYPVSSQVVYHTGSDITSLDAELLRDAGMRSGDFVVVLIDPERYLAQLRQRLNARDRPENKVETGKPSEQNARKVAKEIRLKRKKRKREPIAGTPSKATGSVAAAAFAVVKALRKGVGAKASGADAFSFGARSAAPNSRAGGFNFADDKPANAPGSKSASTSVNPNAKKLKEVTERCNAANAALKRATDALVRMRERVKIMTESGTLPTPEADRAKVESLKAMGFSEAACRKALLLNRNDVEYASNYILERVGEPSLDEPLDAQQLKQLAQTQATSQLQKAFEAAHKTHAELQEQRSLLQLKIQQDARNSLSQAQARSQKPGTSSTVASAARPASGNEKPSNPGEQKDFVQRLNELQAQSQSSSSTRDVAATAFAMMPIAAGGSSAPSAGGSSVPSASASASQFNAALRQLHQQMRAANGNNGRRSINNSGRSSTNTRNSQSGVRTATYRLKSATDAKIVISRTLPASSAAAGTSAAAAVAARSSVAAASRRALGGGGTEEANGDSIAALRGATAALRAATRRLPTMPSASNVSMPSASNASMPSASNVPMPSASNGLFETRPSAPRVANDPRDDGKSHTGIDAGEGGSTHLAFTYKPTSPSAELKSRNFDSPNPFGDVVDPEDDFSDGSSFHDDFAVDEKTRFEEDCGKPPLGDSERLPVRVVKPQHLAQYGSLFAGGCACGKCFPKKPQNGIAGDSFIVKEEVASDDEAKDSGAYGGSFAYSPTAQPKKPRKARDPFRTPKRRRRTATPSTPDSARSASSVTSEPSPVPNLSVMRRYRHPELYSASSPSASSPTGAGGDLIVFGLSPPSARKRKRASSRLSPFVQTLEVGLAQVTTSPSVQTTRGRAGDSVRDNDAPDVPRAVLFPVRRDAPIPLE